jgi:hypothetical protein
VRDPHGGSSLQVPEQSRDDVTPELALPVVED